MVASDLYCGSEVAEVLGNSHRLALVGEVEHLSQNGFTFLGSRHLASCAQSSIDRCRPVVHLAALMPKHQDRVLSSTRQTFSLKARRLPFVTDLLQQGSLVQRRIWQIGGESHGPPGRFG